MRQKAQIEKDLEEIGEKIEALDMDASKKKMELQNLKKGNARLLAQHVGKKLPKSINTQQKTIFELQISIDQAGEAILILQDQREKLNDELKLCGLRESHMLPYQDAQKIYFEQIEAIREKFLSLQTAGCELETLIDEFHHAGTPAFIHLGRLATVAKDSEKIEKDLNFPIFKELRRYKILNEFLPFQEKQEDLQRKINRFTDTLFGLQFKIIPEFKKQLKPVQGPTSLGGMKGRLHKDGKSMMPADLRQRLEAKERKPRQPGEPKRDAL